MIIVWYFLPTNIIICLSCVWDNNTPSQLSLFHFVFVSVFGAQTTISAISGDDVIIQCPLDNFGTSCTGFVWSAVYKGGRSIEVIYKHCNPERFSTRPTFQNFHLIPHERLCCLLGIDGIDLEDQGIYRCETPIPNAKRSDIYVEVISKEMYFL